MGQFKLRDYQLQASDAAVKFLTDGTNEDNGLMVISTGGGKSLILADIAYRLDSEVLIFQPSREILLQNFAKMQSYGVECSMYSASVGKKEISKITFATIGSVKNNAKYFRQFRYILIDEAHGVGTESGKAGEKTMYMKFFDELKKFNKKKGITCKILGVTATPYRLHSETKYDYKEKRFSAINSQLIMLTNEPNAFFKRLVFVVQTRDLIKQGYLARLKYFDVKPSKWNSDRIYMNGAGSEYSENSVKWMMEQSDLTGHIIMLCRRLLKPKSGIPRKGILVFTQFVEDAERIASEVEGAAWISGETTKANRERIIKEFRSGKIKVLANSMVLSVGFDYPELDTVVIGRPTASLALYYQQVGRCIRPFEGKDAWIVDAVGNTNRFGEVGNLYVGHNEETDTDEVYGWTYDYIIRNYGWKQLTGVNQK